MLYLISQEKFTITVHNISRKGRSGEPQKGCSVYRQYMFNVQTINVQGIDNGSAQEVLQREEIYCTVSQCFCPMMAVGSHTESWQQDPKCKCHTWNQLRTFYLLNGRWNNGGIAHICPVLGGTYRNCCNSYTGHLIWTKTSSHYTWKSGVRGHCLCFMSNPLR